MKAPLTLIAGRLITNPGDKALLVVLLVVLQFTAGTEVSQWTVFLGTRLALSVTSVISVPAICLQGLSRENFARIPV